jgi:hypothetical protein
VHLPAIIKVLDALDAVDELRGQRPVHRSVGPIWREKEPHEARAASPSTTSREGFAGAAECGASEGGEAGLVLEILGAVVGREARLDLWCRSWGFGGRGGGGTGNVSGNRQLFPLKLRG